MRSKLTAILASTLLMSSSPANAQIDAESYSKSFTLAGVTDGAVLTMGEPLKLQLVSSQSLERDDVIYGDVKLDLVFRHLQLDPTTGAVIAPYPLPPGVTTGAVEAWAAKISGRLPVGFRHFVEKPKVEVNWHLKDSKGNSLVEGEDVHLTQLGSPLEVSVLLAPFFTTWTKSASSTLEQAISGLATSTKQIQAEVRVTAGGITTAWVPVPDAPIKVQVPQLPVPDVLVGFQGSHFKLNALCLVPHSSPLEEPNDIVSVLETLRGTVDALKFFTQFTALGSVASTVLATMDNANLAFEHRNTRASLDDVIMIKQSVAGICDICNPDEQWDDRLSSLVMISDSKELDFFQNDDFGGHRLTVDPPGRNVAVRVSTLHSVIPVSNPSGAITFSDNTPDLNWGDRITSYQWDHQ